MRKILLLVLVMLVASIGAALAKRPGQPGFLIGPPWPGTDLDQAEYVQCPITWENLPTAYYSYIFWTIQYQHPTVGWYDVTSGSIENINTATGQANTTSFQLPGITGGLPNPWNARFRFEIAVGGPSGFTWYGPYTNATFTVTGH